MSGCCAKLAECRHRINQWSIMRKFGKIGCMPPGLRRPAFFLSGSFIVTCLVLTCLSGVSSVVEATDSFPWSTSEGNHFENASNMTGTLNFWIGLAGMKSQEWVTCLKVGGCIRNSPCPRYAVGELEPVNITVNGNITKIGCHLAYGRTLQREGTQDYSDATCSKVRTASPSNGQHYCSDCDTASTNALVTVIMTIIFMPVCLYADYHRSSEESDDNFEKAAGALGNIVGGIMTLASITSFGADCVDQLPLHWNTPEGLIFEMSYDLGFGFDALIIATAFLIADGCIHLLTPTPERCWRDSECEDETLPLDAPQEDGSAKYGAV